jgi:hypothetical protein
LILNNERGLSVWAGRANLVVMAYAAIADCIDATWRSWKSALLAGDRSALETNEDQLVWLAVEAVHAVTRGEMNPIARRVLADALEPVADRLAGVADVLRRAGWR